MTNYKIDGAAILGRVNIDDIRPATPRQSERMAEILSAAAALKDGEALDILFPDSIAQRSVHGTMASATRAGFVLRTRQLPDGLHAYVSRRESEA